MPAPGFEIAPTWLGRGAAALRFVLFFALAAGFIAADYRVLGSGRGHLGFALGVIYQMSVYGLAALISAFVLAKLNRQSLIGYGYWGPNAPRNLLAGLLTGGVLVFFVLLAISASGAFSFGAVTDQAPQLVRWGLLCALMMLVVGFTEETLFRGFALVELSRAISFWPAAVVLSLLFGALHFSSEGGAGVAWIGGLTAALFGLAAAYSFRATGSLWFAIGYHAGWNYAQTFLFGVADSGNQFSRISLFHSVLGAGPDWLTGGHVGPEGSALDLAEPLAIVFMAWLLRVRSTKAIAAD